MHFLKATHTLLLSANMALETSKCGVWHFYMFLGAQMHYNFKDKKGIIK